MAQREPVYWDTRPGLKVLRVGEPSLVRTAEPVAANRGSLWLSNIDQTLCKRHIQTVYVYKARASSAQGEEPVVGGDHDFKLMNPEPAPLLRDALARALALFYPLTGRLRVTSAERRFEIHLSGEGVLFVDAEANMELALMGCGTGLVPPPEAAKQLVITVHDPRTGPLMAAQVTRFQCGGWVLGLSMNHGVVDGVCASKFMRVWAKLAKLALPSAATDIHIRADHIDVALPFAVDRTCLNQRSPLQVLHDHAAAHTASASASSGANTTGSQNVDDEHANHGFAFRISGRELHALKHRMAGDGHQGATSTVLGPALLRTEGCRPATTFEVLAALLWRARTAAVGIPDEAATQLRVWVNFSTRVRPPLPAGYMGNAVVRPVCATTAGRLRSGPLSLAVAHVQRVLASVDDDYVRSYIDYLGRQNNDDPDRPAPAGSRAPPLSCLYLNSWMRLDFRSFDFGWGAPLCAGPATTDILTVDGECRSFLLPVRGGDGRDVHVFVALPVTAATKFEQQLRHELCRPISTSPAGQQHTCS